MTTMTEGDLEDTLKRNPDLSVGDAVRRHLPGIRAAPAPTERDDHTALVDWHHRLSGTYPDLGLLMHIPNGEKRDKATAGLLRGMGVKAGVPDFFLPTPRPRAEGGMWHGLWLELKRADHSNNPSPMQKAWIDSLRAQGYMVVVCYGFDEARRALEHYLSL